MKRVVLYVPGLGDTKISGRKLLVASWRSYGVTPVVHQMNWADGQSFASKLDGLLRHIDDLVATGKTVSLVGESAGASAAINAYALRTGSVHRVACICGKLRNARAISATTYGRNPAFGESMSMLTSSLANLTRGQLSRIRSVKPVADYSVPPADTIIDGAESRTIPSRGHMLSIILGCTLFGWLLVGFLKKSN